MEHPSLVMIDPNGGMIVMLIHVQTSSAIPSRDGTSPCLAAPA
jgi:hypothetical protein